MSQYEQATPRPALRYYGGAWTRAKWIVSHFPRHSVYVEPCFGAGSVMLHKKPAKIETANDTEARVVNFFQVLRNRPVELIEAINLTPWHVVELQASREISCDPLEDARRFFALSWMSIHGAPAGGGASPSLRFQRSIANRNGNPADDAIDRDDLLLVAHRLKSVQFTSMDAIRLIKKMKGGKEALIYFDPPYLKSTRSPTGKTQGYGYANEVNDAWHRLALRYLRNCAGYVVVSGYRSRLYTRLLEDYGWERKERSFQAQAGSTRTECIWLNPAVQSALGSVDFGLFAKVTT